MNIKRSSIVSIALLALVMQAMPASAATKTTLIRFIPSISATLDQGVITLVPPVSNSPAKFRVEITNPGVAKADGLKVTLLSVGNTEIFYVQDAVTGYSAAKRRSSIYVRPGTPALGAWADQSVAMTSNTFTLTPPTSPSNGGWTYKSSDLGVITLNGAVATIVDGGEATITATQGATSSWLTASATKKVTVTAVTPTVSAIPNVSLSVNGISSFELKNPTSNSSGAWVYTSNKPGVIAVSGNKFTAVGPGVAVITAKQARAGLYRSYTTTFTIDVVANTPKITNSGFADTSVTIKSGAENFSIYAPLSESPGRWDVVSSDPAVVRVVDVTATNEIKLSALKPGTATITAVQSASGNFAQSAPITAVITVKGTPTITAPAGIERIAGDPAVKLKAPVSTSNGAWSYTSSNTAVASINGDLLTISSAGSAVITATQAATSIWNAGSTTFEVRVGGITPTLGVAKEVALAAGAKLPASALPTSNSAGKWNFATDNPAIANVVAGEIVGVAAGSTKITAYQEPAGKFGRSNTVEITVTVSGVAPKPTATPSASPSATPAATPQPSATPSAVRATAGASLAGNTITIIVKNAKLTELKITINGAPAKLGANIVGKGSQTVVVSVLGKVIYTKQFDVK
jgi:hypothetical protein